jgi:hypothetical protein
MIAVKQKTANYCFVACVASMLLDQGDNEKPDDLQDSIVTQFPTDLRKNHPEKSGSPPERDFGSVIRVVTGLGLATTASWVMPPFAEMTTFLRNNIHLAQRIFVIIPCPGFHCVRLSEVTDTSIEVMDPHDGQFHHWAWDTFQGNYYALVSLHK